MSIFLNPIFILTTAFMAFVTQVMWNNWFDVPLLTDGTSTETETETAVTRNLNLLQSHPRCGLTSGGREECWWGCDRRTYIARPMLLGPISTLFKTSVLEFCPISFVIGWNIFWGWVESLTRLQNFEFLRVEGHFQEEIGEKFFFSQNVFWHLRII